MDGIVSHAARRAAIAAASAASPVRRPRLTRRLRNFAAALAAGGTLFVAGNASASTVSFDRLDVDSQAAATSFDAEQVDTVARFHAIVTGEDATHRSSASDTLAAVRRFGRTSRLRTVRRSNEIAPPKQSEPASDEAGDAAPSREPAAKPSMQQLRAANKPPMVPAAEPETLTVQPKRLAPVVRQASARTTAAPSSGGGMPFAIDLPSPTSAPTRSARSSTSRTAADPRPTASRSTATNSSPRTTASRSATRPSTTSSQSAAKLANARRGAPIAPPVPPPVPMSLRPGYSKIAAKTPSRTTARPTARPGSIDAFLPPPAPPVDTQARVAQTPQRPAQSPTPRRNAPAAAPNALPSISELSIATRSSKPAAESNGTNARPAAKPSAKPTAAANGRVAAAPIDMTTSKPKSFTLQPMPNLPVVMPSRRELFPADTGPMVDPELPANRQPATIAANAAETFGGSQPAAAPAVTPPKATAPVERDADVATVSIDTLSPKPAPLAVVPNARSINGTPEPVAAFELPDFSAAATTTGLDGFCPVALCENRELVDADVQHEAVYQGRLYHFSTADALERFKNDPSQYAPAARGRDVVLLSTGEAVVDGELDYAVWYRGRLYLFKYATTMQKFSQSPRSFVSEL